MAGKTRLIPEFVFGNMYFLHESRVLKGLSRHALAVKIGCSVDTIRAYERGDYMPSKKNYNKLAEIFGWWIWE